MNKTLPAADIGITELNEIERGIAAAIASKARFALPAAVALRIVRTAQHALQDAGMAVADHITDHDWIVDLSYRLKNVRRALAQMTKVRVPKRIASEPALRRLRAIAARALEWDDEHELEMVAEFGHGLDRAQVVDDVTEDFDPRLPDIGYEFLDRFGTRYRVTGIDEDEGYIQVELVEATEAIEITEYLAHHRITQEEGRDRVEAAAPRADA